MKKIKMIIDIVMALFIICLMSTDITGVALHEFMGIGLFGLFVAHIVLNFKWVKAVSKNIFKKEIKAKTRVMYGVDVLMFPLIIANLVSGVLISTTVLTGISAQNIALASQWHHFFAYWLLAVLIVHLGLHWSMIREKMRIDKKTAREKMTIGIISACMVGAFFKMDAFAQMAVPQEQEEDQTTYTVSKKEEESTETDVTAQSTTDTTDTTTDEEQPTIDEFLSNLFCSACGRHCPLTNPQCGKGVNQQEEKVDEYNETYQTTETYTSGATSKGGR